MTRSTGQRRHHFKNTQPTHPDIKPYKEWFPPNHNFYVSFRRWLKAGGYSHTALNVYGVATRMALGLLDKPYWSIDPDRDLAVVHTHLEGRTDLTPTTRREYAKGLFKLAEFIRWRSGKAKRPKKINWAYYTGPLPDWLDELVRAYIAHRRSQWPPERQYRATLELVSRLTASLRWMTANDSLDQIGDITPQVWFGFVEHRLANQIHPNTINGQFSRLLGFLHFLADEGQPVCLRIFRVSYLEGGWRLPKDASISQLQRLLAAVEKEAGSSHTSEQRMGLMDRAWVLLMLHCGLRSGEVRRLRLVDIDWEQRKVRIEQSKGLNDRYIWLSEAVLDALQTYLGVRGPGEYLPETVFVYRHKPLGIRFFQSRLKRYAKYHGVKITAHQLRHSCATLLLNAGAPVTTVQAILGHKRLDTTMQYARLYDGTVAEHYYQAMQQVEGFLDLELDVKVQDDVEINT